MKHQWFTERSATFSFFTLKPSFKDKNENRRFGEYLELRYILGAPRQWQLRSDNYV